MGPTPGWAQARGEEWAQFLIDYWKLGPRPKAWAQLLIGFWKLGPSIIGYLIVDGFRPKIDVFFLAVGPKHDNDDGGSDDSAVIATQAHADKSSFDLFRGPHGRNADHVGKVGPKSKE